MIKIVHITASLGFGGVERVVTALCDNLNHKVFEVHIISLSDTIPLAASLKNINKVKIHTCGRPDNISSFGLHFQSTLEMYRILNHIKPDIIHSHVYYLNNLAYAVSKGIPHVITLHGPSIMALRNRARQMLFAAVNAGRKKASHTIVVSESVGREIKEHFHSNFSTIEVIHNGIDTDYFKPELTANRERKEIPIAINIARHVKGKGIECLLQAWKEVINMAEAKLFLVGDGPEHERYKAICRELGLRKSVRFLGNRNDVKELMDQCDFGIFPSETEGLPMAPAEMMAMELPVIGSDIPPLLELLAPPEGGDIVPVNDSSALTGKILEYLGNSQLVHHRGRRARERIITHFSLRQQVKKHEIFYKRILRHA